MALDILQIAIVLVVLFLLVTPGRDATWRRCSPASKTWLDRVFDPVDNAIYRVSGVDIRASSSAGRPTSRRC